MAMLLLRFQTYSALGDFPYRSSSYAPKVDDGYLLYESPQFKECASLSFLLTITGSLNSDILGGRPPFLPFGALPCHVYIFSEILADENFPIVLIQE